MAAHRGSTVEIHYADKAYRTRSIGLLVAAVALCAGLLWQLNAWLDALAVGLASTDPETARRWLRLLFVALGVGLAVPSAALGLQLRRFALASRVEGRFPPREAKTLRDVRVLRDAAALTWARRVEMGATAALALAALLLGWAAWAWSRF